MGAALPPEALSSLIGRILDNSLLDSVKRSVDDARHLVNDCIDKLADNDHGDKRELNFLKKRLGQAEGHCGKISGLLGNPIVRKLL